MFAHHVIDINKQRSSGEPLSKPVPFSMLFRASEVPWFVLTGQRATLSDYENRFSKVICRRMKIWRTGAVSPCIRFDVNLVN